MLGQMSSFLGKKKSESKIISRKTVRRAREVNSRKGHGWCKVGWEENKQLHFILH